MRRTEFDILKGIGILLVMIGHAIPQTGFANNLIYGFHMPLFFFASGIFFRGKPLKESILKDIKTLMIPWMTFSVFLVLCSLLLKVVSDGEGPLFRPLDEDCYVLYYTIWFLPCLFLTRTFYRIIDLIKNKVVVSLLCWGAYFVAYALRQYGINIPFFIDSALAMTLFYHLGHVLMNNGYMNIRKPLWLSLVSLTLYAVVVWYVQPQVNIKYNAYPIYLVFLALVVIFALYQICCFINSKFLAYCGTASLVIMGIHHPIYDVVMCPILNRLNLPDYIDYTIMVTASLLISLVLYQIMIKYTPQLLGKEKKTKNNV